MKTCFPPHEVASHHDGDYIEQPYDLPDPLPPDDEPDDTSDLDDFELSPDDECWDVFLPDDDQYDRPPDPDDFWGSADDADWDDEPE
jgi:hypothetical protein